MMGKITMKSKATRKQNEVRRDIEQYSSCLGDIRKYIHLFKLLQGVIPPHLYMVMER